MKSLAIVIPAYKESFLRETLESIAAQTDKRFNLYIGNDCSPHNIKEIADEFADRIPLTYHRFDSNIGGKDLVAQWERCVALTKGEPYIWLFSDDDVMESRCVEAFYNHISRFPNDDLMHFDIKRIEDLSHGEITVLPKFLTPMTAGEFLKAKAKGEIISFVVEFIFSRSLYEKTGGFENFDLAWGSDSMTWLKMAAHSNRGIITISNLVNSNVRWRSSHENISPDKSRPILVRKIRALIQNAAFIKRLFKTNTSSLYPLFLSFRWLRFPLGEIYRNRMILTRQDIVNLSREYSRINGYTMQSILACMLTLVKKR